MLKRQAEYLWLIIYFHKWIFLCSISVVWELDFLERLLQVFLKCTVRHNLVSFCINNRRDFTYSESNITEFSLADVKFYLESLQDLFGFRLKFLFENFIQHAKNSFRKEIRSFWPTFFLFALKKPDVPKKSLV